MTRKSLILAVIRLSIAPALASVLFIGSTTRDYADRADKSPLPASASGGGAEPAAPKLTRTYPAPGATHVTLTNTKGPIDITAWDKREISLRADSIRPVNLEERMSGGDLTLYVKRTSWDHPERVGIAISAPRDTSFSVKSAIGEIYITGITGHLKVDGLDGDIHLVGVKSPSVDVKVIHGDIYFDGELSGSGPYYLQSMHGDIDVTLPDVAPFDLAARALTERINIGGFFLSQGNREPKTVTGKHEGGGPRLCLTAYDGRIFMHKK